MSQPVVGAPRSRVDGPAKVTGAVRYTADHTVAGMLYAVVVPSTIAKGRVTRIDDAAARSAPGVVAVMTQANAPRVDAGKKKEADTVLFLLQDDVVTFDRQPVAVVIARTFEQATHAADLVRVSYDATAPVVDLAAGAHYTPKTVLGEPPDRRRGDPDASAAKAPVKLAQTYRTPTEHHNPMEPHATLAAWNGDDLMLYDATQWPFGVKQRIAAVFGIAPERVTVASPFIGGAFGCKGTAWSHVALAAMAAKLVNQPVRLVVTRPQMFGWVGHRPQTEQRVALAAQRDGTLVAVQHDVVSETSILDEFVEPSGVFSRDLYAVPNYGMSHTLSRLNISKPTFQRGPGESTGSFAMESAMDELSYELRIDPVELRLRNYAETQPDSGKPYSSKRLRECYAVAAQRFNWRARAPVGSLHRDGMLVGVGMATASRATHRSETKLRIRMDPDGSVVLQCATIEQGTGTSTVYGQLASEILGIPPERVRFEFGDTTLPEAPIAAGSQTAGTVGSAVVAAAQQLRERLGTSTAPAQPVVIDVATGPDEAEEAFATQAFGAHVAEVEVEPDIGTVRVTRFVGAFDGGRILNEKTARSQYLGGIVWGISMALFEDTRFDARTARIMNANLADYLVPTNADIPDVDIAIVESDDHHANPAGVKGIGEVGISGSAAAVANAVYHATGVRVRELPITPDKLA
jgi:xanthine dehydrogenase YagR molybdenum-binding subunit